MILVKCCLMIGRNSADKKTSHSNFKLLFLNLSFVIMFDIEQLLKLTGYSEI